jgi:Predicted transcriptional regulator
MQINRLFEIVYVLLRQKTVTVGELAERFNVSRRTIYRDIDALSLAGIPVYTEKGKGGGVSLLPEFVLSKSILSEQEQNAILAALKGLSSVKMAESEAVLEKLSSIFNKTAANWLEVDFTDWGFMNGRFFDDLKMAILSRKIVEFDYYSTYGEKTHRCVEPLQLYFKAKAWYIKAFCLKRQDVRLFKLTRICGLTVTDEAFSQRDLLASVPTAFPEAHQKQDITLQLRIAPEMAYRVYDEFDEAQVEKQADGCYLVTVMWPEDEWVYGTILSYGEHIEVLAPKTVREIVREKMLKAAEIYL